MDFCPNCRRSTCRSVMPHQVPALRAPIYHTQITHDTAKGTDSGQPHRYGFRSLAGALQCVRLQCSEQLIAPVLGQGCSCQFKSSLWRAITMLIAHCSSQIAAQPADFISHHGTIMVMCMHAWLAWCAITLKLPLANAS